MAAVKSLGITALIGGAAIVLTDAAGILLRQPYNPVSNSVSNLALGPTGWVQDVGMYFGGVGIVACAVGLYLVLNPAWEVRLGELFLLLAGLGIVFAAVFKVGVPGQKETIGNAIHGAASLTAAVTFLPVCFLVSPAIRDRKKLFIYTIIAGVLAVGLEVGRGRLPSDWAFFGLHERLIGANVIAWISVISWDLLVRSRHRKQSSLKIQQDARPHSNKKEVVRS